MKILKVSTITFGVLFSFSGLVKSQVQTDSLWLDEVRVSASRIDIQDKYQAVSSFRIDSTTLSSIGSTSFADAIQFYTPLFVRNNGPGGLSTVNSRGFASSQTQVVWNGFPLNHPMLGVTDLSIIPLTTLSGIVASSGTGNTSFGDRGGGTIAIQTKELNEKIGLVYQVGSFGEQQYSVEAGSKIKNWKVGILAGFQSADNDFEYSTREFSNEAGGFVDIRKKRAFNQNESATILLSAGSEINNHQITSRLWILDSENQIPGGISSLNDKSFQKDGFTRWLTNWKYLGGKSRIEGALYLAAQQLDFIDENTDLNSLSDIQTTSFDLSINRSISNKLQFIGAFRAIRNSVETTEYPAVVSRNEAFLNINTIWAPKNYLYVYPAFSVGYNSDYGLNYTGNIGLTTELIQDELFFKINAARNFTAPSFNDLYWPGSGDPTLDPESILRAEMSILHVYQKDNIDFESKLLAFVASVDNGIRWLPNEIGTSSPENIEALSMNGFELSNQMSIKITNWKFSAGTIISQTLASIAEERFEEDGAVDKQLIYTPEWQYKFNLTSSYKEISTTVFYAFVDDRYTSSDHSSPFDPLRAYKTLDWISSININHRLARHTLRFMVRNVFDEDYSVIRDYPMPGRHFKISVITKF